MADKILKELTLKIWRQKDAKSKGGFETYKIHDISTGSSFLEMLDILNEQLVSENKEPVAFDHDCREGICGTCSLFIDGRAHGPDDDVTTCQLHMRRFEDGATITIEPWRCGALVSLTEMQFQSLSRMQTKLWMLLLVSVVELVPQLVRTLQLCFSWLLKFPSWLFSRKERSRLPAVQKPWWLKWTNSDSGTVPTPEPANQNVRRASLSNTSLV